MDKIEELLTRSVAAIYPSKEELEKVLRSGKKFKLYQGFDPTGTQLHLGHMIGLRKLKQWQDLGHHVIFLIGDGTGQAGDPSGKTKSREKFFTREQLRQNAREYVLQASKIVRFDGENPVEILYNGDWLSKLNYSEILDLFGHFSLQQLAERDLFQERMKQGIPISLREFIYPILQGYDSVAMRVDLEIGGTDQTFNMLVGRTLVRSMQQRDKFVMITPLLVDSQGQKIGKTEGNVIALTDKPEELFGKIMALPDDIIVKGLEYLTDVPMVKMKTIENDLKSGTHPVQYKKLLAIEIVKQLHDEHTAMQAQDHFEKTVQQKELPTEIEELTVSNQTCQLADLLVETNLAASKSDAKRLVEQGGVAVNDQRITEPTKEITITYGMILKVGKRKFVRLKTV